MRSIAISACMIMFVTAACKNRNAGSKIKDNTLERFEEEITFRGVSCSWTEFMDTTESSWERRDVQIYCFSTFDGLSRQCTFRKSGVDNRSFFSIADYTGTGVQRYRIGVNEYQIRTPASHAAAGEEVQSLINDQCLRGRTSDNDLRTLAGRVFFFAHENTRVPKPANFEEGSTLCRNDDARLPTRDELTGILRHNDQLRYTFINRYIWTADAAEPIISLTSPARHWVVYGGNEDDSNRHYVSKRDWGDPDLIHTVCVHD